MKTKRLLQPLTGVALLLALSSCSEKDVQNRPPGAFTATVSDVAPTQAKLSWTASADPDGDAVSYTVEINNAAVATNLTVTDYTLGNLTTQTTYNGKVTARDASGNSTSTPFNFTTSEEPLPGAFNITTTDSTHTSITVTWSASVMPNGGPVNFDVLLNDVVKASNLSSTSQVITGLTPSTAYTIKVVAKSAAGKTRMVTCASGTKANTAPGAPAASSPEKGFSFVALRWTAVADADGDAVTYIVKRNGVDFPVNITPSGNVYTYYATGLAAQTDYSFEVVAKDALGLETRTAGGPFSVRTMAAPPSNFTYTVKNSGSDVEIEWTSDYTGRFDPSASSVLIEGVQKSMANMQVSFLNLPDGKLYTKIILPGTDFPQNTARTLSMRLGWGAHETHTQSAETMHTRYVFTATMASVATAELRSLSNGDKSVKLTFTGNMVSERTEWSVKEIKLNNSHRAGTISTVGKYGMTADAIWGSLTNEQYAALQSGMEGYIIIEDAAGFHRLNFTIQ